MPLFGRSERRLLPTDTPAQLALLGRHHYNREDGEAPWQFVAAMYQLAQQSRERFLGELAALVVPAGGWSAYGALRLLWEVFSADLDQPDFDRIALAGLQFLRSHGVPASRLSPYELRIWHRLQGDGTPWLAGKPPPPDRITPLRPGESRKVAQVFPGPSANLILVRQDAPDRYVALIDGEWSEEDPRRVQNEWHSARTMHELYIRLGDAFQVPCYWADPELELYFPLPPPTI
jgi:hypothetical protein